MKSFYHAQIAEQWQNKSAGVKLRFFYAQPLCLLDFYNYGWWSMVMRIRIQIQKLTQQRLKMIRCKKRSSPKHLWLTQSMTSWWSMNVTNTGLVAWELLDLISICVCVACNRNTSANLLSLTLGALKNPSMWSEAVMHDLTLCEREITQVINWRLELWDFKIHQYDIMNLRHLFTCFWFYSFDT